MADPQRNRPNRRDDDNDDDNADFPGAPDDKQRRDRNRDQDKDEDKLAAGRQDPAHRHGQQDRNDPDARQHADKHHHV
ncbi:unnamed protein product [Calicophoron daubneyi]|uniref:Uncharacterized protein n=1 Tax=Calicophoron daubneyi TaxID=300641 RepID=A0AAV2TA68_CALDB